MSSAVAAFSPTPPVNGAGNAETGALTAGGSGNIWVVAATGSSNKIAMPSAWQRQMWLDFFAGTNDAYLAFGDSNITVDETVATGLASNAFTTFNGAECIRIPAGTTLPVDLSQLGRGVTHFALKQATTAMVRICRTSGHVGAGKPGAGI